MDPNTALEAAREALARFQDINADLNEDSDDAAMRRLAAHDLADAFEALDGWLSHQGFLPNAWSTR